MSKITAMNNPMATLAQILAPLATSAGMIWNLIGEGQGRFTKFLPKPVCLDGEENLPA
ncbi:hypothetical protein OAC38_00195 [Candidatus Poseidoniaceae archaeon]|nr:hypothetical protein [Candidatus Poseidoniaceae archaeon]